MPVNKNNGNKNILSEEQKAKILQLAEEVFENICTELFMHARFLSSALIPFEYFAVFDAPPTFLFTTDGETIYYNPVSLLLQYRADPAVMTRKYLHTLLHCIFRHMLINPDICAPRWDLACDIAIEKLISDLPPECMMSATTSEQQSFFNKLQNNQIPLTAERIFAYLNEQRFSEDACNKIGSHYSADSHMLWYVKAPADDEDGSDDEEDCDIAWKNEIIRHFRKKNSPVQRQKRFDNWKKISERMQVDFESFVQGMHAGNFILNLREVNRERCDYTAFLKKFAVMREEVRLNHDEFDYIFYTYGLTHYDRMPLIEPLEYKDVKAIKEFVIAIDTSGSVLGDTVQRFVQKTYNILKSQESFHSRINLHIIQCDACVQEDVRITTQEEFDKYLKTMKLRGFGGTDFRPVFEYVDKLIKNKEFTNLTGLIYFTDGCGIFPVQRTPYKTAFAFLEDNKYNNYDVPPWAIKLVLRDEDF